MIPLYLRCGGVSSEASSFIGPCFLHTQESLRQDLQQTGEDMIMAQAQRDRHAQRLHELGHPAPPNAGQHCEQMGEGDGQGTTGNQSDGELDMMKQQLTRIAQLEKEVQRLRTVQRMSGAFMMSARRQSMGAAMGMASPLGHITAEGVPPSPIPFRLGAAAMPSILGPMDATAHVPGGEQSMSMDLQEDAEFAAEEHAHRCVSTHRLLLTFCQHLQWPKTKMLLAHSRFCCKLLWPRSRILKELRPT